ncbi:hypothetical protein B0H16DRAFT_1459879 [Mycena metata]|uniref:Uncharacterized protein n=1 Tax=Mycena metata TaxID=1033252 RepID=A0AAD7IX43_9AGAR|nr:hypothetical protein B0H16DRAFT_1459879 [Mycena metata]
MSTTDVTMSIVLSPLTIIRSVELALPTPRTFAAASTSPTPPVSRTPSAASLTIPPEFFGPWFLTKYGILVMDRTTQAHLKTSSRAFDQSEDEGPTHGGVFDQADSPCYAASDFEAIIAFLPLVPDLANNFRRIGGRFQQCLPLFFVVEDHKEILTTALEAQRYHIEIGDPTLGIYVFPTRAQAEDALEPDVLIAAAA